MGPKSLKRRHETSTPATPMLNISSPSLPSGSVVDLAANQINPGQQKQRAVLAGSEESQAPSVKSAKIPRIMKTNPPLDVDQAPPIDATPTFIPLPTAKPAPKENPETVEVNQQRLLDLFGQFLKQTGANSVEVSAPSLLIYPI
jgi:hypothetical protein